MLQASFTLFALVALFASTVAALTAQDAATVFGSVNSGVTGTSTKTDGFTLTALANGTHALISLEGSGSVGWWGVGWGTQMSDADLIVAWPTNGEWTLSHRTATGHKAPNVVTGTSSFFTIVPELSTATKLAFLRPLNLANEAGYTTTSQYTTLSAAARQPFVWAAGSKNPGSAVEDAPISFHDVGQGSLSLDMSKSFAAAATAGNGKATPATSSAAVRPWTKRDSIIVAHAVFGCLAWMIFAPLGALIARLARQKSGWVKWHMGVQVGATGLATLITIALGIYAVADSGGIHFMGTHQALGLALAILMICQTTLGKVNHFLFQKWAEHNKTLPQPETRVRPWNNWLHMIIGISLIIMGYTQIRLGLSLYTRTPTAVIVLFWIILALTVVAYLFGVVKHMLAKRGVGLPTSLNRSDSFSSQEKLTDATVVNLSGAGDDVPRLPQTQPMSSLTSLHDMAVTEAAVKDMKAAERSQIPGNGQYYANRPGLPTGPYPNHTGVNVQRSLSRAQSNDQLSGRPQARDYARPPYGYGSAPYGQSTQNGVPAGPIAVGAMVGSGPSYSYSNAAGRAPLSRGPSQSAGRTQYSVPIGGKNMPTFIHHQHQASQSSNSSSSHSGHGHGQPQGQGQGGQYFQPPMPQKIELAQDWVKKSGGGLVRKASTTSTSTTTTEGMHVRKRSQGGSSHGHGYGY